MFKLKNGRAALLIAACIAMLTGCGGSSGSTASNTPSGQIQGIATPSGVSVVTANNAQ